TGLLASAVALLYVFRNGAVAPDIVQGRFFVAFVGGVIGGLGSLTGAALGGFVLGVLMNILQSTLPITLKSHTQLFAFLAVIAILVFVPDGLITVRGGAVAELWRRLRKPKSAAEGAPACTSRASIRSRGERGRRSACARCCSRFSPRPRSSGLPACRRGSARLRSSSSSTSSTSRRPRSRAARARRSASRRRRRSCPSSCGR